MESKNKKQQAYLVPTKKKCQGGRPGTTSLQGLQTSRSPHVSPQSTYGTYKMGQNPAVPAVAVEPKVRINSPTTIESSSEFHLLELHGPTISAMFLMGLATLSMASLALFIYRAVTKRRKRKEARIDEEARKESIMFRSPPPQATPYRWSPAGPTAQDNQALPILLATARKIEEGEFRHGAGRLTEVWDGQSTIPHLTPCIPSRKL